MAYIPDEAITDSAELSPIAWRIYCFLCMRRNRRDEIAYASPERLQAILGVSRANAYRGMAELLAKGWVQGKWPRFFCEKGDFGPVIVQALENPKSEKNRLISATENLKSETAYKASPVFLHQHTFTQKRRPAETIPIFDGKDPENYQRNVDCEACNDSGIRAHDETGSTACECARGEAWARMIRERRDL